MSKAMSVSSEPDLPNGVENDPLDTALLISNLRELYRNLRYKAETSSSEPERQVCCRVMHDLEEIMSGHREGRKTWLAVRDDLVGEIVSALRR